MRHTFTTSLVKKGVPIYEIQKLLGNASVTTTQVYSNLAVGDDIIGIPLKNNELLCRCQSLVKGLMQI
ncbi:site-specific integrase [candidate division KSB1 bacterium]|nr:site-specific integrase [candidate division KSB1 bacterium]